MLTPESVITYKEHVMHYFYGFDATCETDGRVEHWYCSSCDFCYSDFEGKVKIHDTVIPSFGHVFVDGICERCGDQVPSEGLEYELSYSGDSYTVTGRGTCTDINIVIPAYYNGLPVTKIGPMAFTLEYDIVTMTLPETLTQISTGLLDDAFFNNYNLVEIYNKSDLSIIPGSLDDGTIAFYAKNVYTPDSGESKLHKTADGFVFYVDGSDIYLVGYTGDKQEITLPDSYNGMSYNVKDYAFIDRSIISVVIPEGVSYVGFCSFSTIHLVSVTVMSDKTEFNNSAFDGCYKLVEVYDLTQNPVEKGSTYRGGLALHALDVYTNQSAENHVVVDNDGYIWYNHPNHCYLLGSKRLTDDTLVIPESCGGRRYELYKFAFSRRDDFTRIDFPETLTSLGNCTFTRCYALEEVTIPLGVTKLSGDVFAACSSLKTVNLHSALTDIESGFDDCISLEYIFIPKSVTAIGGFRRCNSLAKIEFEEGTQVSKFYELAFYGTAITEFTFPSTITDIGNGVFFDCQKLATVNFEEVNALEYISYQCFGNCFALKEIKLPDSVYRIDYEAFIDAYALESIVFGNTTKPLEISEYAFSGCHNLSGSIYMGAKYLGSLENPYLILLKAENKSITSCTVHPSARIIYYGAFNNCSMLESITMSDSLTEIQDSAFYYCTSLKSITIPENIVYLGTGVLSYCSSLKEIHYNAAQLTSGPSLRRAGSSEGLTLYIGKNVREIYSWMFCEMTYDDTYLTMVVVEDGSILEKIGDSAFRDCTKLQSINFPDSLRSIGERTFEGCSSLREIYLPEQLESIGNYAFADCSSLTLIEFDAISMNEPTPEEHLYLFANSGDQTVGIRFIVGNRVKYIPKELMYGGYTYKTYVSTIEFEDGSICERIGAYAFDACVNCKEVTIPESIRYIEPGAISCSVDRLYFNAKELLSPMAYENGSSIGWISSGDNGIELIIGKDVTDIADYCFYQLYITTLTFEEESTCKRIGNHAFSFSLNLDTLTLPDSIEWIGDEAFYGRDPIKEAFIPSGVKHIGVCAFYLPLERLYYNAANLDHDFLDDDGRKIYWCASDLGNLFTLIIGSDVKEIPGHFMHENTMLSEIIFDPNSSCEIIGEFAFYRCENLKGKIELPSSIKRIESYAFAQSGGLTSTDIPDSVEYIGDYAFYGCALADFSINTTSAISYIGINAFAYTSTSEIVIPASLTYIGEHAFRDCPINSVYYGARALSEESSLRWIESIVYNIDLTIGNEVLYIPDSPFTFMSFDSIIFEDGGVCQKIGAYAFYGKLEFQGNFEIPNTVTEIGEYAFSNCTGLNIIIQKDSQLTYIGKCAFYNTATTHVVIPTGVTFIGEEAFSNAPVESLYYNAKEIGHTFKYDLGYGSYSYNWIGASDNGITVTVGKDVSYIPMYFMNKNVSLHTLIFEEGGSCASLENYAFYECENLTQVILPDSVEKIMHNVFNSCSALSYVFIPDSVTFIGNGAFYNCNRLTSVEIHSQTQYSETSFTPSTEIKIRGGGAGV